MQKRQAYLPGAEQKLIISHHVSLLREKGLSRKITKSVTQIYLR